ncbi:uncharacterized protein NEMAJ01_0807 [Nematocida major]|uniref:uncharacterized protein n=1 Tax=Nematocida major TaxID=1912982 RepID=UPI0020089424|nr:uncharacterized protein NEMAJ01_0807 [Nematocida major]KAH9385911.1 hypothetical protein NEMAJ01_0807 [Nematocida major]
MQCLFSLAFQRGCMGPKNIRIIRVLLVFVRKAGKSCSLAALHGREPTESPTQGRTNSVFKWKLLFFAKSRVLPQGGRTVFSALPETAEMRADLERDCLKRSSDAPQKSLRIYK